MPPNQTPRTPFGRALRNMGWLLGGKGVGAVLSIVYLALATRTLGIDGFGRFALILGTGQAAAALVGFQTWQVVVGFGMRHLDDRDALLRLVRACLLLDGAAAAVGCLLAAAALALLARQFGWSAEATGGGILFCTVLLLSIRSTAVGVLRLHDRFAAGAAADAVTPVMRFAGALVAVWAGAGVAGFLTAWAAAEVACATAYWTAARRTLPGMAGRPAPLRTVLDENDGLWRFAWQSNLNATLNASGRQFAVVAVGFVVGPAAAGGYRLAHQLAQALVRVSELFARGVFPEVSRAHAEGGAALPDLVRRSVRLALAAGAVTCVGVPLLGYPALHLIAGEAYLSAYPLLVLLGIAAGLDIAATGFEPVLLGTGRAASVLRVRVGAALLLLVAIVPLMAWAGTIGAGVATLVSAAFALVALAVAMWRTAGPSSGERVGVAPAD